MPGGGDGGTGSSGAVFQGNEHLGSRDKNHLGTSPGTHLARDLNAQEAPEQQGVPVVAQLGSEPSHFFGMQAAGGKVGTQNHPGSVLPPSCPVYPVSPEPGPSWEQLPAPLVAQDGAPVIGAPCLCTRISRQRARCWRAQPVRPLLRAGGFQHSPFLRRRSFRKSSKLFR